MAKNNIHYIFDKKQQVKGLANNMSYYRTTLIPYVEKLIRTYKKDSCEGYSLSLDDIDESELYVFATHLIEEDKRELHSIWENRNYDEIVCSLFKLLKSDDIDSTIDFAELVKKSVVDYYRTQMQELIDDNISFVESEDYADMGMIRQSHPDNGETYWVHA